MVNIKLNKYLLYTINFLPKSTKNKLSYNLIGEIFYMKNFNKNFFKLSLIMLVYFITIINTSHHSYPQNLNTFGVNALHHIKYLSKTNRVSGTKSIIPSQKYIKNEFQKYGYEVTEQNFKWPLKNTENITSKNIIAFKQGLNNNQIIIGAHYDSTNCNGADDNASGVSVVLELAQRLSKVTLPYSIKFITFDAEELGLFGSRYFVKNMSKEEIDNTILYINIDSILSGDELYIYGDHGYRGWFRDEVINLSNREGLDIKTSPGLNKKNHDDIKILEGECFDYSDHVYFKYSGIPFAYFESTSWESINPKTGYPNYRNKSLGMILHSEDDNIDFITKNLKDKPLNNLSKCISSLYKIITENTNQITIITNINDINYLKDIRYELYLNDSLIKILSHLDSNKITLNNLSKGTYKIKVINETNLNIKCPIDNKPFNINNNTGTFYLLYEDNSSINNGKEYDGILINIYGDMFNDPQTNIDDIYKEFLKITNLNPKVIYNKVFTIDEIKKVVNSNKNYVFYEECLPASSDISPVNNKTNINLKSMTKMFSSLLLTYLGYNFYGIKESRLL